ncbi:SMC-Scp complex subunit ScpB [Pendulispora rubella]|uniref:SMC-Scp complex subunit ScpB n=1 Tax=Pendulispora rubella TaxID=2741070 RepID=A0ABZ2KWX6_9BACT
MTTEPTDNATPEPEPEESVLEEEGSDEGGGDEAATEEAEGLGEELGAPVGEDVETTVDLVGDEVALPLRDDFDLEALAQGELFEPEEEDDDGTAEPLGDESREHLKGLLEALVFASDKPLKASELARLAEARQKEVKGLLDVLKGEYEPRGIKLDEVAGGFIFHTAPRYGRYVRDLTKQKPVKLSRAQMETLAILAYRQPITRPEIDEIRGVDTGAVLKMLLERDLIKILGKKDEPGRPLLYGTTPGFLEFFGLKSLKDLPTLHEFTELNEESRKIVEKELGEVLPDAVPTIEPVPAPQEKIEHVPVPVHEHENVHEGENENEDENVYGEEVHEDEPEEPIEGEITDPESVLKDDQSSSEGSE